jgi:hypothetical protein
VHGSVAVNANDEHIAEQPALFKTLQVSEVKNVKAAVGEDDAAAVAFLTAEPQNRLLRCQDCRIQRVSMRTGKNQSDIS